MNKKGFTLIEILAVLVIIAILIAIAMPNIQRAIQAADTRQCASNIRNMDAAIQLFFAENRQWPTDLEDNIAPLLEAQVIPECPFPGNPPYQLDATERFVDRQGHFTNDPGLATHDGAVGGGGGGG